MPHAQEDQTDAQRVAQATVIYLECLFSIMVWDWLASLPTEWHLVWLPVTKSLRATEKDAASRAPLQVKLLRSASLLCFVVVRYLALIEFALFVWAVNVVWTYDECARIQHFFPYASGLVALAANGIMCLRVMAIWSRDRLVSMSLGGMLVVVVALVLWGCQYTSPPEGITACIPTPTSTHLNVLYLAPMVYDFIILVLTLTRAIMLNRSGLIGPLLRTIVRDGILYFFAVFTCNLLAVVFELQTAQPLLRPINASLATIGTSIFCSKIFFALKRATSAQIKRNQSQSLPSSGPYPLNAIPVNTSSYWAHSPSDQKPVRQNSFGSENYALRQDAFDLSSRIEDQHIRSAPQARRKDALPRPATVQRRQDVDGVVHRAPFANSTTPERVTFDGHNRAQSVPPAAITSSDDEYYSSGVRVDTERVEVVTASSGGEIARERSVSPGNSSIL